MDFSGVMEFEQPARFSIYFLFIGPEQAIMCGVTTVRLVSNGNHNNEALVTIRSANVEDIDIATLICPE